MESENESISGRNLFLSLMRREEREPSRKVIELEGTCEIIQSLSFTVEEIESQWGKWVDQRVKTDLAASSEPDPSTPESQFWLRPTPLVDFSNVCMSAHMCMCDGKII